MHWTGSALKFHLGMSSEKGWASWSLRPRSPPLRGACCCSRRERAVLLVVPPSRPVSPGQALPFTSNQGSSLHFVP